MEQTAKEKAVLKSYELSQSGYMADHAELIDLLIEAVAEELRKEDKFEATSTS